MKKLFKKVTALFVILYPLVCLAENVDLSAHQLLKNMDNAVNQLNYEISFVQTTPSNMDSFRYRHVKVDNKIYAQLVTLDGVQQEIIQRDNLISYFQPNAQAFTINSGNIVDSFPAIMRANVDVLAKNYNFEKLGRNRVAGRLAETIRIIPKDDFRYQYLAFVDSENHLLLRSDMLDREGNLLDQFRVVTLYIDDDLKGLTDYLNQVSVPPMLVENKLPEGELMKLSWSTNWLPEGFKQVRFNIEQEGEERIESALFSDGLFSFTLYVAKAAQSNQENAWKQGAYTVYSETFGDNEVTFIGQLPIASAKRIVQDIKFMQ